MDIAQFEAALEQLTDSVRSAAGNLSGAAGSASTSLRSTAQSFSALRSAADALAGATDRNLNRQQTYERVTRNLVDTMKGLVTASIGATGALYGAQGAFSSLTGTVTTVSRTFSTVMQSVGSVSGQFGAFGKSIQFFTGVLGFVGSAYGDAINVQLGGMQRQLDSYMSLSKAGATFGGSLYFLQQSVAKVQVPMEQYIKLVSSSADNLARMGIGMSTATAGILSLSKDLFKGDRVLANLYGNFDNLAEAVSDYMALQAQVGKIDLDNAQKDTAALRNYLIVQKEITEITGKNAKQLKADEERRRQNLLYQLKQNQIGPEAAANAQKFVETMTSVSPALGRLSEEFHAAGGETEKMSIEMQTLYARLPGELQTFLKEGLSGVNTSRENYNDYMSALFKKNEDAFARMPKEFADMYGVAINKNITGVTDIAGIMAGIQAKQNLIGGGGKEGTAGGFEGVMSKLEEQRKAAEAAAQGQGPQALVTAMETVQKAEMTRLETQTKIDMMFNERFGEIVKILEQLGKIQQLQVELTNNVLSTGNTLINAVTRVFGNGESFPQAPMGNPMGDPGFDQYNNEPSQGPINNPANRPPASGRTPQGNPYTTGPLRRSFTPDTTVGPERVSMNNLVGKPEDFTNTNGMVTLVQALNDNTSKMDELLRVNKDTRDNTQRLVYAA